MNDDVIKNNIDFDKIGIINPILKNLTGEGAGSGASVYLINDATNNKKYILKFYPNEYFIEKKYRIFKELEVYKKLLNKFPYGENNKTSYTTNVEYKNLCKNDTKGIDFAKLIHHGVIKQMEKPNYYIIITFVDGIVLSKSILPENNEIWTNIENVKIFAAYFLKSIKYLHRILGKKFIHKDLHPDNIYVYFDENQKLEKVTLIDFDLVDSSDPEFKKIDKKLTYKEKMEISMTKIKKELSSYFSYKTRSFICYCYGIYKMNKKSKLDPLHAPCDIASELIHFSKQINNVDIRHWFVIVMALQNLSNTLSKNNYAIQLNEIFSNCFSKKHINFNSFKPLVNYFPILPTLINSREFNFNFENNIKNTRRNDIKRKINVKKTRKYKKKKIF
jgi:hypothetical protein